MYSYTNYSRSIHPSVIQIVFILLLFKVYSSFCYSRCIYLAFIQGVFILLLLSGERNFGVRLNKPYTASVPMDIPVFSGSHADLLIIVFHKVKIFSRKKFEKFTRSWKNDFVFSLIAAFSQNLTAQGNPKNIGFLADFYVINVQNSERTMYI